MITRQEGFTRFAISQVTTPVPAPNSNTVWVWSQFTGFSRELARYLELGVILPMVLGEDMNFEKKRILSMSDCIHFAAPFCEFEYKIKHNS